MSRVLCRVDRKSSVALAEDGTSIRLERKGKTQSEWKFAELNRIQVVSPRGVWNPGYLRFQRSGQPVESSGKYSPHTDPDAILVVDASDLQAGAVMLRQMGAELGAEVITDGTTKESESADTTTLHSMRTKKATRSLG